MAAHERGQLQLLGLGKRTQGRPPRLGIAGRDQGVQPVGFGQQTGGPGEIPDLAGVDPLGRQACLTQGGGGRQFIAAAGLQNDEVSRQKGKPRHQLVQAGGVVGHPEDLPGGPEGHMQTFFGDIDAHKDKRCFPTRGLPVLHMRACDLATVRARARVGVATRLRSGLRGPRISRPANPGPPEQLMKGFPGGPYSGYLNFMNW